jgi:hypothetical protein
MTLITYLTRIHFADGVLEEALWAEMEAWKKLRPLIVTDDEHLSGDMAERILAGLPTKSSSQTYTKIPPIPTEHHARKIAAQYRDAGCDVLLAFGTSRAIDLAKVARIAIAHEGDIGRFSVKHGRSRLIGSNLPHLFAIPSISGVGAAVSAHTPLVLRNGERTLITCKTLIPAVTICDPTLSLGANAEQSASAGADAISHCIEAFLSKSYNPPAEGIAIDGLKRAVENLERVLDNGADLSARREMMAASLNGALALQKGLGACHAISNALELVSDTELDQGELNRITLPSVLRFNEDAASDKFRTLSRTFGFRKPYRLADAVEDYFQPLPLPKSLSGIGLREIQLKDAADIASKDLATDTNPRRIDTEDYLSIMLSVH